FLQEHRVLHLDLQHPAADAPDPRLLLQLRADRLRPRRLQRQPVVLAAPAAGREEPAEDVGDVLRSLVAVGHRQVPSSRVPSSMPGSRLGTWNPGTWNSLTRLAA